MRHQIRLLTLALVIGPLVLAGCASSGTQSSGQGTATATPTARISSLTATPKPPVSATPAPNDLAALGWKRQGLSEADQIQQAPGTPGTIYACGLATGGSQGGLGFSVSYDGGKTWQSWTTSIPASACLSLRVSSSAPQDVAIYSASCRAECGQGEFYLHYSLDGGKHWTQVYTSRAGGTYGWVGTALFADGAPPGTPASGTEHLAVSKNGGSFSWTTLPYPGGMLFSTANTLYVVTGAGLYSTINLGATWSKVTPAYQGNAIIPTIMVPGGPMLGYDARFANGPNVYPLFQSRDGGATWQPLTLVPGGLQANGDALEAPDGTVYVTCIPTNTGGVGIYKLTPGASHWALLSPLEPERLHLLAITWDANGHPTSVWGLQEKSTYTYIPWIHAA